jgi:short-subunit dehydrogenase
VNNAGQGLHASIENIGVDDFRELLDLNLVAPLVMMQAVMPHMRKQGAGSIVNVSSGATFATYPGSAAYTSSKAGLNMLSSVARLELADEGIVVSTMYPSITATEFYSAVKAGSESAKAQETDTAAFAHPPELVANSILALIRSGDAQADLVPEAYGGSFER